MKIEEYSYLWDKSQRSRWALNKSKYNPDYGIVDLSNPNEVSILVIEDDEIYYAVIQKMLSSGVRILSKDEMSELTLRGVPEELLNADKDELWNSIKGLLNQENDE